MANTDGSFTRRDLWVLLFKGTALVIFYFVGSFLYKGIDQRRKVRQLQAQGIPILPHSWLWGHLKILKQFQAEHPPDVNFYVLQTWLTDNATRFFPKLQGKAPPVIYLDLWPVTDCYALVYDAVAVTQFTTGQSLEKSAVVRNFLVHMTDNRDLFSSEGQVWKTWRSRFNPGFSSRHILTMVPQLLEEVAVFVDNLKQQSGQNGSWGEVFPLEPKTTSLTFDVIVRALLGFRLHDQSIPEGSELKRAMLSQLKLINEMAVISRGSLPWVNGSPARLRLINQYNDVMNRILLKPVQEKLSYVEKPQETKTVVDFALKYLTPSEADSGAKKSGVSDEAEFMEYLSSNLKVMMFAGHDTTSVTVCYMSKCLQDNPECLKRMREEHDQVLGRDANAVEQVLNESPHLVHSLPYTLGVIKETLRLNPLASTVRSGAPGFYLTTRDDPDTRYPMGVGWAPWTAVPGVHRNPAYWCRSDEFLPERWCVDVGHPLHVDYKNAWSPFSSGPRNCIGMELALTELKLVAVMLYRRFEIREAWEPWDKLQGDKATPHHMINGERLYYTGNSTVHPKDGMPVQVRMLGD